MCKQHVYGCDKWLTPYLRTKTSVTFVVKRKIRLGLTSTRVSIHKGRTRAISTPISPSIRDSDFWSNRTAERRQVTVQSS